MLHPLMTQNSFSTMVNMMAALVVVMSLGGYKQDDIEDRHDPSSKYFDLPFSFGQVLQVQEADGRCPIRISFGSECCGIDSDLRQTFDRYLVDESRVTRIYTQGWGREGEIDYCLEIPKDEDLEPVVRKTQSLLNRYGEPKRGYAHITRSAK